MTKTRTLGRSGIEVSAIGMGCWAIGGPWYQGTQPLGWGAVDDDESVRTIHRALDLGVNFFDTSSNYGAGHSERVLGRALAGQRDRTVIASKFGYKIDEERREALGEDASEAYLRSCLDDSLRRLGTDYVDVYQLHLGGLPIPQALDLIEPLEDLVAQGKIRAYGWSTDDAERAAAFADAGRHCTAIQLDLSVMHDNPSLVAVCEQREQAGINRGPLAMGLLSGKYQDGRAVGKDDVRGVAPDWLHYFKDGAVVPAWAARFEAVRDILTSGGRTPAQGALAWLWARSPNMIPIPGCRTVAQIDENAGAMAFGPLSEHDFTAIESILRT